MKTKFEIILELYKKGQVTSEECSILMEKETIYLGYPSFHNPYPQLTNPLPWIDINNLRPYYSTTTGDNSNGVQNDKTIIE